MAWDEQRTTSSITYQSGVVKSVLSEIGLSWSHESGEQLTMRCPFHNEFVPSFTVNTVSGQYYCFVPSCASSGGLEDLIIKHTSCNSFEALRVIARARVGKTQTSIADDIKLLIGQREEFEVFDPEKIAALHEALSQEAIDYMKGRGISLDTLNDFRVGYSEAKGMVTIPGYSHTNIPVGVIGRSLTEKRFQYSKGFPIAKVWFNLNRARRESSTAIVVEASMDVLKIHEAGFPNAIAILGGNVSGYKMELLNKYFDKIVIMTDDDSPSKTYKGCKVCKGECKGHNPGRDAGDNIAKRFKREVFWAAVDDSTIYPKGAKDPGDMSLDDIRKAIRNAQPDYIYRQNFR